MQRKQAAVSRLGLQQERYLLLMMFLLKHEISRAADFVPESRKADDARIVRKSATAWAYDLKP